MLSVLRILTMIFKSKTMLFGLALSIAGAAQAYLPYLEGVLTPTTYGIVTAGIGFMVMILRAITTEPIQSKAPYEDSR